MAFGGIEKRRETRAIQLIPEQLLCLVRARARRRARRVRRSLGEDGGRAFGCGHRRQTPSRSVERFAALCNLRVKSVFGFLDLKPRKAGRFAYFATEMLSLD